MISWLLVLVLLSAVDAITTPTAAFSTADETQPTTTTTTTPTTSQQQLGFVNATGDISTILTPNERPANYRPALAVPATGATVDDTRQQHQQQQQQHQQPISETLSQFHQSINSDAKFLRHNQQTKEIHIETIKTTSPSLNSTSSTLAAGSHHDQPAATHYLDQGMSPLKQPDNGGQQKSPRKVYTNQFVIEVKGGEEEARRLAEKHGFIYLNHIIDDYYHLEHRRLARRSLDAQDMSSLEISIEEEPEVLKIERQVLKKRVKRDFMDMPSSSAASSSSVPLNGRPTTRTNTQQQQQQRPTQMLRPNGRTGSQFVRPPNQPPPGLFQPMTEQPPTANQRRLGQPQLVMPTVIANGGRGDGGAPLRLTAAQQQQYLDALEMNSSGPPPFFMAAAGTNFSSSTGHSGAATPKAHRPPPPPIPSSEQHLNTIANANQSAASHYANETLRPPAPFNDPSWPLMWYLDGGARNGFDLNVQAAWKMGYTGKGIVITILDDGLEKDHPDLQANYDPLASFDINGDDADPMPRYDPNDSNRHGTRCAGEVAAMPDNNICSIGIAYNSKVGGVRMLDGDVTDAVEARSLGLNNQHIHIYSASWGPDDNGKTVDGPGELATRAFIEGVTNGRQGLGSIFVFASGNGGREHDNCNCDGYTNSIWTLSISSATENGYVPWYIEACSSTLATTYSSGSYDERQIATTDIRHSCTNNHTGTSASAPIAAGICALVLESNPRLTWRDMQHIVVRTAKPANLIAKDWRTNAMGRNVSHAFGYGLMDAAAMIQTAQRWTSVPVQYTCEVRSPQMDKYIPAKGFIELKLRAECANVRFLEHVQSKVTLTASRRGDLHIYLTSPHGTRSTLLAQRPNDQAEQGFKNWPFMTVHNWGESPNGVWTLEVHNDGKPQNRASLKEWTLILYGTSEDPNKHLDHATSPPPPPLSSTSTASPPTQHSRPTPSRLPIATQPPPPPSPSFAPVDTPANHQQLQPKRPQAPPPPPPPQTSTRAPPSSSSTTTAGTPVTTTTQYESSTTSGASGGGGGDSTRQFSAPVRADFEIVSAPATGPPRPQVMVFGGGDERTTTSLPSTQQTNGDQMGGSFFSQKPTVIDAHTIASTLKPPVGSDSVNRQQQQQPVDQSLDSNQLDMKMQTKDYRSSGGGGGGSPSFHILHDLSGGQQAGGDNLLINSNTDLLAKQRDNNAAGHLAASNLWLLCASSLVAAIYVIHPLITQQRRPRLITHASR